MAPRSLLAVWIAASAFLMAGCAGDEDDDKASSSQDSQATDGTSSASSASVDDVVRTDLNVDVGGRSIYMRCWGEPVDGESTVLLISGQGPTLSYWDSMAAQFALDGHHLCAYDRAGVGSSEVPPEDRRTTNDQVADMVALLDGTDLNEPLVLVAHSLGSLPAIGLASQAPERVAGVVFIDPWTPRTRTALLAALPPEKPHESAALMEEREFLTEFPTDPTQNSEHLLVAASDQEVIEQLDKPGPLFGDRSIVVLQAPFPPPGGLPRSYAAVAQEAWTNGNKELAAESTRGRVIKVEDTGHNIHEDQPEVVMDAILDVLAG
jgi:pimeloyl-ACP methyl ester carboxylesterase